MRDYATARRNMVESQIRPNKVRDGQLIDALLDVPRERFVPPAMRDIAYVDEDLSLGHGRWLMEPMVFARLVEAAGIGPSDRVLEVGCATGYGAAILSRLAGEVVALESDAALLRAARQTLADLRVANVHLVEGRLEEGCPARAPYNIILFAGAIGSIPAAIAAQLAEGGRLLAVFNTPAESPGARMITRVSGTFGQRSLFDATTRFLPGFALEPGFVF